MSIPGPSPESVGATNTRSLSTRPCSRNAAASVGPPSRRRDWTPSAASALELLGEPPGSELELGVVRERPAPERDSARLAHDRDVARVEPRVVPAHGSHADGDRVGLRAQEVDEPTRVLAGHPARAGNGDATVQGDRDLVRHEGATERDPGSPLLDLLPAAESRLVIGDRHLDTGLAQPFEAAAGNPRVRVRLTGNDAPDSCLEQRVDARRRIAVVRARFERDVDGRAGGSRAGRGERIRLRVRLPLALVPALADDLAVRDHDRADDRVRAGRPTALLRQLQRTLEERLVHRPDPRVGAARRRSRRSRGRAAASGGTRAARGAGTAATRRRGSHRRRARTRPRPPRTRRR